MAAALSNIYAKQGSGIALFGRCQGVPDVFGGGPKGVCLNPEPGIQCAVILLQTCAEQGIWEGGRGGQGEAKAPRSGGVIA